MSGLWSVVAGSNKEIVMSLEALISLLTKTLRRTQKKRQIYRDSDWFFVKEIKEKFSPILWCEEDGCAHRFIEIQEEIRAGYKRTKCPFCEPYKHWNRKDNAFLR